MTRMVHAWRHCMKKKLGALLPSRELRRHGTSKVREGNTMLEHGLAVEAVVGCDALGRSAAICGWTVVVEPGQLVGLRFP